MKVWGWLIIAYVERQRAGKEARMLILLWECKKVQVFPMAQSELVSIHCADNIHEVSLL